MKQDKIKSDSFVINPIYGSYELIPHGLFGFIKIWRPNYNLKMTEQEQYDHNKINHPYFCREEYLSPAININ